MVRIMPLRAPRAETMTSTLMALAPQAPSGRASTSAAMAAEDCAAGKPRPLLVQVGRVRYTRDVYERLRWVNCDPARRAGQREDLDHAGALAADRHNDAPTLRR